MSESPTDGDGQELAAEKIPPDREEGNSEAARWRRKLRDTERQRDELASRLADTQRGHVETLLAREAITVAALEATGATLSDLLDADGRVDADKVRSAAEAARAALGIDRHAGLYVPAEGRIPAPPSQSGFSSAFAPKGTR